VKVSPVSFENETKLVPDRSENLGEEIIFYACRDLNHDFVVSSL
jgi:hypothetical protein